MVLTSVIITIVNRAGSSVFLVGHFILVIVFI